MNRNQILASIILLLLVTTLIVSGYYIYQSQEQVDKNSRQIPSDEIIADTSYGPVDIADFGGNEESDTSALTISDEMPEFPGGQEGLNQFLGDNLEYPQLAKEQGVQGKVWLSFIVYKTGRVANVSVEKGIGGGCDEEAVRVIRMMPKWKPGKQDGKPVNVKFRLPIKFTLH